MTVRSATLLVYRAAVAGYFDTQVAPGTTWIVKDVSISAQADPDALAWVYVWPAGGSGRLTLIQASVGIDPPTFHWTGWLIMQEGSILQVQASAPIVDFYVSGTVLSGVAPNQPQPGRAPRPGPVPVLKDR